MNDCWNTIGVRGDKSCPELPAHVHCRNCPVFSAAAAQLLEHEAPSDYIADWTGYAAAPVVASDPERRSLLIFRVGAEWLALPGHAIQEVAERKPVHSIPHRRRGPMLGLVNIRGELLVCLSLARVLGLDAARRTAPTDALAQSRMLVLRRDAVRVVCVVDEVHGLHSVRVRTLQAVPATIAKGTATHTTSVLPWQDKSVGVLDERVLFSTFDRNLT